MYKRRLYKQEHADKDELSDSSSSSSSSSSSDSESEAEPQQEEGEEEGNAQEEVDIDSEAPKINGYEMKISSSSSGSGYESEDSSEKEVKYDSSDDDEETGNDITNLFDGPLMGKGNAEAEVAQTTRTKIDSIETDYSDRILKCKSVYKCRLCPRLVCLTEESLRAHLNSKRHARSEKLLKEGRLKFMLNSDGEIEEDPETHAERHARTLALAQQDSSNKKKKNRGRQRQRLRLKRKKNVDDAPEKAKEKEPAKNPTNTKRRKVGD